MRSLDEWRGAPARRHAARVEDRRADPLSRPRARARLARCAEARIAPDLFNLTVLHPAAQDEREVAAFVARWLRDEAERLVLPRVAEYAGAITPATPTVKLSNARTEWGSCNQRGEIRLNWRLVQLPPELAHYVVAHEVAHLVELNHSPRFWAWSSACSPARQLRASARRLDGAAGGLRQLASGRAG